MPEALLFVLVRQLYELSQTEQNLPRPNITLINKEVAAHGPQLRVRAFTARGTRLLLLPGLALRIRRSICGLATT